MKFCSIAMFIPVDSQLTKMDHLVSKNN